MPKRRILALLIIAILFMSSFSFAASFTIKRRVVMGWANGVTYDLTNGTGKIVSNARYINLTSGQTVNGKLSASIHRLEDGWFGDKWVEQTTFDYNYDSTNKSFSLNKTFSSTTDKYSVSVWRPSDEKDISGNYLTISGNVNVYNK